MFYQVLNFDNLVFIDTETTGFDAATNRVIEVGVVRVEKGKVVDTFQSVIKPDIAVPEESYRITGVKKKEIKNAPNFDQVQDRILEMLRGGLMIAHNAKFDYDFLEQEFLRRDISFNFPYLCTVKLSRALFPHFQRHDLDSVTRRLKIDIAKRHRAYDDAFALWEAIQKFQERFTKEKFDFLASPIVVPVKNSVNNSAIKQISLF